MNSFNTPLISLEKYYNKKELSLLSASWIDLYSPLLSDEQLCFLFEETFNEKASYFQIEGCAKMVAEQLMLNYYHNEAYVKSAFIDYLADKKTISFFELPINSSRSDICSINGRSCAYEIKTKYDSLNRLGKQLNDYLSAFEYVYVICSRDKLEKVLAIVPSCVGVYCFDDSKKEIDFILIKEATTSPFIKPLIQLSILRKAERKAASELLDDFGSINEFFKECLKTRYKKKWERFCKRPKNLNRLDYQYYFNLMC